MDFTAAGEEVVQLNGGEEPPATFSTANAADTEELKLLKDTISKLPSPALQDLLSIRACCGCIFRVFGVYENAGSFPSLITSNVKYVLREVLGIQGDVEQEDLESQVCRICLGILEFLYRDKQGILVNKDCAADFAQMIAEAVKQEHQQIDGFSLEVSLPPVVSENEQVVRLYMMNKYGSETWYKSMAAQISVKDALKLAITDRLETLLGAKSNTSTFRIRLAYGISEESNEAQNNKDISGNKRRKMGNKNGVVPPETSGIDSSCDSKTELNELTKGFTKELEGHGSDSLELLLKKNNQSLYLAFNFYRSPIFIGGRYLKYSRNVSQTCWIIEDERKGEASVEEIIGGNILPFCLGDSYKFHAAGREDIDVRMLGTGRPFLVEIQNARQMPSEVIVKEAEMKINTLEHNFVKVKNLKVMDSKVWELMREGESEKQKQYAAVVWISRPLEDDDLEAIASTKNMQILQNTPIRVLHRRSPLTREKVIHWMKIEKIAGSSQFFLLHLCTQAGTYIKEFVHGDLGRTHPSIGSILGCRAEILQLDVTDVKMDGFCEGEVSSESRRAVALPVCSLCSTD